MNTFSQLQNGLNDSNAYSTLRNNILFNEGEELQTQTDEEKQKRKRIELFRFMSQRSNTWKFALATENPIQKKKVKDLPKQFQDQIIQMNNTLKSNKSKLDQIKDNNTKLKLTLGQKLKDTMDQNILSLKQINN
jgi:hypothetical protein